MTGASRGMLLHPHAERQFIVGGGERDLEPSSTVVAQLRALNPRLGLKWLPAVECFALTCEFSETDPRRAFAREQTETDDLGGVPTHDIVAVLPITLSQDDIPGYALQRLVNHGNKDFKQMALELHAHNEHQSVANAEPWKDKAMAKLELLVGNRVSPTVHMSDTEARTTRVSDEATKPVER